MKCEVFCFDCNGHGVHGAAPSWPCQTCYSNGVLFIDRRGRVFSGNELLFSVSLGRLRGYYSANAPRHIVMPWLRQSIRACDMAEMAAWAVATTCMLMVPVSAPVMAAGMAASIMVAVVAAGIKARKRMEMLQWVR